MFKEYDYVIGQRWLNYADPALGLGLITAIDKRCLTVSFPAVDDERQYALGKAPLCRMIYQMGDTIKTVDEASFKVTDVVDNRGILTYIAKDEEGFQHQIIEFALHAVVNFSAPLERLFAGQVDNVRDYHLKIQTLKLAARLHQSTARGLIGARTEHIEHQLYIAAEVAKRFAPRVLLADEVGLGKTIEAGLILHHQLLTGRARRVLIIVPLSLTHQWLVEMRRRFNLFFSLFNEERFMAIDEANPFDSEQLIIVGLDFLMQHPAAAKLAQTAHWDLVVVDEAHHLHWSEERPSAEYLCVEQFATRCLGLLLLTATPEQLGKESHFARLRLLDSARFHSLAEFIAAEANFAPIATLAHRLLAYQETQQTDSMSQELHDAVSHVLGEKSPTSIAAALRILLDIHGTGRVLFRNTRAAIAGFKKRILHAYPLAKPKAYRVSLTADERPLIFPETLLSAARWLKEDPRVLWLIETIRQCAPHKVLVIAANASTAISLNNHLRQFTTIRSAAFHEGLTIIERDRAGAYFADSDEGADCLICSEIGSEGRNFQFSHHLILFDLPFSPDLLEQRIGRLDRIGQQQNIHIHVPYIEDTPMEALFSWYHLGLNLFEKSCSFAFAALQKFESALLLILNRDTIERAELAALITKTKHYSDDMQRMAEAGRDRLLELSSCNSTVAAELIQTIEQAEDPTKLQQYMARVFNAYGVSHEYHSLHCEILSPSEHMQTDYFPGLKQEGVTVTYSRAVAVVREDIEFLSVEHPMVTEAMEMILTQDKGQALMCTMSLKTLPPGTLFLEAFYTPKALAPRELSVNRYLPLTPIRVLITADGKNIDSVISHEQLSGLCKKVKRDKAYPIICQIKPQVEAMFAQANMHAEQMLPPIKDAALRQLSFELGDELSRMTALQAVNPSIRPAEIDYIKQQQAATKKAIDEASLSLEGLRVVVNC